MTAQLTRRKFVGLCHTFFLLSPTNAIFIAWISFVGRVGSGKYAAERLVARLRIQLHMLLLSWQCHQQGVPKVFFGFSIFFKVLSLLAVCHVQFCDFAFFSFSFLCIARYLRPERTGWEILKRLERYLSLGATANFLAPQFSSLYFGAFSHLPFSWLCSRKLIFFERAPVQLQLACLWSAVVAS